MSLHLFPVPVECQRCGTVVDDPATDRCPECGELLKERRMPSRLAGVERKYANLRILLGFVRFLGAITAIIGVLLFLFAEDGFPFTARLITMLASILIGTGLFVVGTMIEILADIEENSRASFRMLQSILQATRGKSRE